jgi:hypothetical protein
MAFFDGAFCILSALFQTLASGKTNKTECLVADLDARGGVTFACINYKSDAFCMESLTVYLRDSMFPPII